MSTRQLSVLALVAALAACSEQQPLTAPPAARPQFEISDAAHAAGNAHFFFLPPIAQRRTFSSGTFDDTLAPIVTICALQHGACGTIIATFTRATSRARDADNDDRCDDGDATALTGHPGSDGRSEKGCEDDDEHLRRSGDRWQTIRVNRRAERYAVRWYTGRFHLTSTVNYRITVSVGEHRLGYADVDVVPNARAAAGVDTSQFVPLVNGRTIPIRFRIEVGALGTLFCPDGRPGAIGDLPEAIAATPAGGTVLVCAGTHAVSNVSINKPITITSESGAMATLDAGSASMVFFVSNNDPAGAVNITRLRFTGGESSNVAIGNNAGAVNISANEFNPSRTGLDCNDFSTLNIDNNRFVGGNVGVNIYSQSGTPTLRGNTFVNQNDASIGLHGSMPSPVVVEGNTFRGCGPIWCLFTELAVTAVANTVEIDIGRPTNSPLFISNSHGGTSIVTDNVITGTGVGSADRSARSSYPIGSYAIHVVGAGRVERNRITNAYTGIGATPAVLTGSDNVITHTFAPFGAGGNEQVSTIGMTRNDLLDYVVTLDNPWPFSAISLTCNFWGSPSGPNPSSTTVPPTAYTPFSVQPIAYRPEVACP